MVLLAFSHLNTGQTANLSFIIRIYPRKIQNLWIFSTIADNGAPSHADYFLRFIRYAWRLLKELIII